MRGQTTQPSVWVQWDRQNQHPFWVVSLCSCLRAVSAHLCWNEHKWTLALVYLIRASTDSCMQNEVSRLYLYGTSHERWYAEENKHLSKLLWTRHTISNSLLKCTLEVLKILQHQPDNSSALSFLPNSKLERAGNSVCLLNMCRFYILVSSVLLCTYYHFTV